MGFFKLLKQLVIGLLIRCSSKNMTSLDTSQIWLESCQIWQFVDVILTLNSCQIWLESSQFIWLEKSGWIFG